MRVKRGIASRKRHQKLRKLAEGFIGRKKSCYKIAKRGVEKAMLHAYVGRHQKKRHFRQLWIQRINAGAREYGLSYSKFIYGLGLCKIEMDRKMLADLAYNDPAAFGVIASQAKKSLEQA